MKVQGSLVLIKVPTLPKSVIELSPEARKKWEDEQLEKHMKLIVHEVGVNVTECKKGDEVFVANRILKNADTVNLPKVGSCWIIPFSQVAIVF